MNLFLIIPVVIVVFYLINSIKILAEYERGVIFRLGRLLGNPKGPGIILVFAPIDRIVRVSLRQVVLEVPPQDIITRDNVTLKVNGSVVAQGQVPAAMSLHFTSNATFDLGCDLDSPVSLDYYDQAPFAFNGTIGTTKIVYPKK